MIELTFTSTVGAPVQAVWDEVTTVAGINQELMPLFRMTAPRGTTIADAPTGRPWFRSWVLLFGVLPIDFDHLQLVSVDPPHGFHERSTMLSASVWEHRRSLTSAGAQATTVTDTLRFTPRRGFAAVLRRLIPIAFRHRHRRLRRRFGTG